MKKLLFALLYYAGATRFATWWHRNRVVFLCYHGVTKRDSGSADDPKGLHVNYRRFLKHLTFLQRHYRIISLDEYLLAKAGRLSLLPYSLVLTFDDGFRNFLTVAAPILAERNLPATVFLITDHTTAENGSGRLPDWTPADDKRCLSWGDVAELKKRYGFTFGSHTCSHSRLLMLSPVETERELADSRTELITRLGIDHAALSYPKGEYSELLAADAQKIGYACAVTTDRGMNELNHNPFTLGRALIGDRDDIASLAVRVSGLRWWLVQLRSIVRGRRCEASKAETLPTLRSSAYLGRHDRQWPGWTS